MQHYAGQAFTDIAKPAGIATIAVKIAGTINNATIYSDDGVTAKSNPFTANALGQFDFYAASGKYDITVSGTQITTYTLANQVLFDPFEQTSADTAMVVKSLTASAGLNVPAGQVLSADQIMPANSAGIGGFVGLTITVPAYQNGAPVGTICAAANEVRAYQFFLPYAASINKVTVGVASSVAGAADVGIYSSTGARLLYTNGGFNTGSNLNQTVNVVAGPIFLPAGVYYLAQTATAATAQFVVHSGATNQTLIFMNNGGVVRCGIAANTATAGVLPATLGAITANFVGAFPVLAFFER